MKKVRLNPDSNPIGTRHLLSFGGANLHYYVVAVWGADTFAPTVEPLVVAEYRAKSLELANPFLTLPLSVFAEVFQYSDEAFWIPVKQYQDMSEGEAEIVD